MLFVPHVILCIFPVCLGELEWGAHYGWSFPAERHLQEMGIKSEVMAIWVRTITPLAGTFGLPIASFFSKRVGPKQALILQCPLNLLCLFLMAFFNELRTYCTSRFFAALFSVSYVYCGEQLMIESVHRNYQKILYAIARTSFFIGILLMNLLGGRLKKTTLCIMCSSFIIINALILLMIPESPVFLMNGKPMESKTSLRWYRQQRNVREEINVIHMYVYSMQLQSSSFTPILKTKVVKKSIFICALLFVLKSMSGYYLLLMDSNGWFSENACINLYYDTVIFSVVVVVMRFLSYVVHLHCEVRNKKMILISTLLTAIVVGTLGGYKFYVHISHGKEIPCITLPTLCVYSVAYEFGLSFVPEVTLYDYLPAQIYETVQIIIMCSQWSLIFVLAWLYLFLMNHSFLFIILWVFMILLLCGFVFIWFVMVESQGKQLMQIQIALGGNPIGSRGSRRQRIPTPFDTSSTGQDLVRIIKHSERNDRLRVLKQTFKGFNI